MNKSKGGRGHKAVYETVAIRVPRVLLSNIDILIKQLNENGIITTQNETCTGLSQSVKSKPKDKSEILSQLDEIRKAKRIGKDTINQILELIYS